MNAREPNPPTMLQHYIADLHAVLSAAEFALSAREYAAFVDIVCCVAARAAASLGVDELPEAA